jgi:hypothetical protein
LEGNGDDTELMKMSFVNTVLDYSKVIEETTLMRLAVRVDELNSKEGIRDKYMPAGIRNVSRPYACVSHEENDAEAARVEAGIRSNTNTNMIDKVLLANKFRTKRTSAKRRLSALQRFVEKKGDLVSDDAIAFVARMYDIDQMDRLERKRELHENRKVSLIFDNMLQCPVKVIKRMMKMSC